MTHDPSLFLRRSLLGNALFSTTSGLSFSAMSVPIAAFLGDLPAAVVLSIGLQLLLFAAALVYLATREVVSTRLAMAVIVADLLWVAGTAVAVPLGVFSSGGAVAAVIIANVVLLFAILQAIGVRRVLPGRAVV